MPHDSEGRHPLLTRGGPMAVTIERHQAGRGPPKLEKYPDASVAVLVAERVLRISGDKKLRDKNRDFSLAFFTLHHSQVRVGLLSVRFVKTGVSVMMSSRGQPEVAKGVFAAIQESQRSCAKRALSRAAPAYSSLQRPTAAVCPTPNPADRKRLNSFASPHRISPSRWSPPTAPKFRRTPHRGGLPVTPARPPIPGSGRKSPGAKVGPRMTSEQKKVVEAVLGGKSVFFTGGAGTGKSFVLHRLIRLLKPEHTAVTSSTGLAASHLGGQTIHSFAGIGSGGRDAAALAQKIKRSPELLGRWKRVKTLIMDEISMLDGRLFDKLEQIARLVRQDSRPFGGVQLVLTGDFLQLPPVSQTLPNGKKEEASFCFEAKSWRKCIHKTMVLKEIKRQEGDAIFTTMLNEIRRGICSQETQDVLSLVAKRKHSTLTGGVVASQLLPTRREVDAINERELARLSTPPTTFTAADTVYDSSSLNLDVMCSARPKVVLKVGAQVMLTKTFSPQKRLVNGSRGIIVRFTKAPCLPVVKFLATGDEEITIPLDEWVFYSTATTGGRAVELGRRRQIPLQLAWALSIHKSQGMTLDCAVIKLDTIFEYGQAYVALSRCRSLDSVTINSASNNFRTAIRANPKCLKFYEELDDAAVIHTKTHE
ncbi:hypothetical protein FOZ61_002403 [Perkinsus olseni]|uniref:ATP-dependent DNA helicase n=1 Tax=Perkinsus olseni TaxID=32597 RepID=A0A7J6LUL9_PEROL|nr:hypothetical protein FOZ61_002403 [Perkinsus olseni]